MNFAAAFESRRRTHSALCAGCDPDINQLPPWLLERARSRTSHDEDFIAFALASFYDLALTAWEPSIACIKPNLAFYEQYGIGGLRAFRQIVERARALGILTIADAKRGDIGSTAQAYSSAFLGPSKTRQVQGSTFECDAMTISPFLGFDTVEPFVAACRERGKGVFVLAKTSNPGSAAFQSLTDPQGRSASTCIAEWLGRTGEPLRGPDRNGLDRYSSLGAVVGATHPEEALQLRAAMPTTLFLMPGVGAQGGSLDSLRGVFDDNGGGVVLTMSRGLLPPEAFGSTNEAQLHQAIHTAASAMREQLRTIGRAS